MASVKDLRNKALSDMSVDELKAFIKKAEGAGYEISKSKELGKAVDLIKVQSPSGYDSKQVESAKLKLSSSTKPETQARLGISGGSSSGMGTGFSTGSIAPINLNTMYDQAMNDPALKALQDELIAKKTARDSAEADINDNPFYTEATRVGRLAKLSEKADDEINTLQSQIDGKKADALVKINIATQQYDIESKAYQQNLDKLNTLISSGAIVGASSKDISQIALATGMSTDMVRSIVDTTKKNQRQTQVVTATDDNGNVTVAVIDSQTGERISQNSLGAIGNKQTGSGTSSDDKQQKAFDEAVETGIAQLQKGESWGTVWNRIYTKFKGIGDDEDLRLAIDSGLGTSWREGGAYERYKSKQSGDE